MFLPAIADGYSPLTRQCNRARKRPTVSSAAHRKAGCRPGPEPDPQQGGRDPASRGPLTAWHRVGGLPTPDEQRAYLFRIVINEALHILRYPHRRWERLGVDTDTGGASWEALDEQVQARADLRLLWKAIGELPEMRRDVVALRAAGYEYREIAASLGVSISTVRSHISYARKQLSRTVARDWEGAQG